MTERKKRKLGEIEQEISICKANLSLSEGKFIGNLSRTGPAIGDPQKPSNQQTASSLSHSATTSSKGINDNDEAVLFIKNLNKLRDSLEQKNAIMQTEFERNLAVLQSELSRSKSEAKSMGLALQLKEKEVKQAGELSKALQNKVAQLQKTLKQKTGELNEQVKHHKKENAQVKIQNKSLKADNKIIMNHLDRLTQQIKIKEQKGNSTIEEREMRVMRSLYQETLPNIQLKESQRRKDIMDQAKNKVLADDLTDRNGQLKTLLRRLNEEVEILKRQKQLLSQENKQKHTNLENQKLLVAMVEEQKVKLNSIIIKMGDKIMNLEQINQTLKETFDKTDEGSNWADQSYYRTTRTKAGQFYYRK